MWEHCGIVRSIDGLKTGLKKLQEIEKSLPRVKKDSPLDAYEFRNFLQSAKLVLQSALKRKESRGLQCLKDYPEKNPKCLKHYTLVS
jgi:L-aspartate oxidase